MAKDLKNYITLTEIYLNEQKEEVEAKVSIKPSDIICMKDVEAKKHVAIKTSVFLKGFNNPCQGFAFDGPILVKETREEIDKTIEDFYKTRKKKDPT